MKLITQAIAMTLWAGVVVGGVGCRYERVVNDPWGYWEKLADQQNPDRRGKAGGGAMGWRTQGFAILLVEYEGGDGLSKASALAARLQRDAKLTDVWYRVADDRVTVFRGHYPTADGLDITADLRQTRTVTLDGARVCEGARIVSLSAVGTQISSRSDLRNYPGYYSLQVGYYDEQFEGEYRKAAEQMVQSLRDEGHDAFFYHGPTRSMVTVGLFTDDDFARRPNPAGPGHVMVYGSRIRDLQQKFKYNLGNGRTLIEKRPGQPDVTQPSFLVRVPE